MTTAGAPAGSETPVAMRRYRNPYFGIELSFPEAWVGDPAYGGQFGDLWTAYTNPAGRSDGFVQLDAFTGPSLAVAVDETAHHKLKPYGEGPLVSDIQIAAGDATLILPDPSRPDLIEAVLFIAFPAELLGGGAPIPTQYPYLALYTRAQDIGRIAGSLRFIDAASLATPVSPPAAGGSSN